MSSAGHFCAENSWDAWDLRDENVTVEPWRWEQSDPFDQWSVSEAIETSEGLSAALFVKSSELVMRL